MHVLFIAYELQHQLYEEGGAPAEEHHAETEAPFLIMKTFCLKFTTLCVA